MVMPDALGITYIHDLSPPDMEKVRSVALVELTITFEDHNLSLRPRRALKLKNIPGVCSHPLVYTVSVSSLMILSVSGIVWGLSQCPPVWLCV